MTKILITGNGFDLKHYLPTLYKDFIKILTFIEQETDYNFDTIYSNSENYSYLKNNYSNDISFDENKIIMIKSILKVNKWYQFFKSELEIESWIDFEIKIEYVLNLIFDSTDIIQKQIFDKTPLELDLNTYNTLLFENKIENIEILNFFKIIKFEINNGNIELIENFLIKKYNYYITINTEKIAKHLYSELISFKKIFNLYFEIFILPLYNLYLKKENQLNFTNIDYHFTFNYTPTFEKLYQESTKTNYLHGQIGKSSNLVIGINEIPDYVKNKIHYLPFTKYFQKLNENTDFQFLNKIKNRNDDYTFIFYGHSLDLSDSDYINEVFDYINSSNPIYKNKIIIVIHCLEAKFKLLTNLLNIRGKDDIVNKMRNKTLQFELYNSEYFHKLLNSKSHFYTIREPKTY